MRAALRRCAARPVLGAERQDAGGAGNRETPAGQRHVRSCLPRRAVVHRFTERFTATVFAAFLDRVARQAGRKVHVVADRHPVHRSKAVRVWLEVNADRVELHLMPGYSPELNPDELLDAGLNATSTPPAPTTSTASPTRPDASCTAANADRTSSAATSRLRASATPSCRQLNTFCSKISLNN
ncbi:transposase [Actinosynnema sp. NPDC050801]|uniref:transposase n=1 Tax=unclassified Actinosynnema TaxID=2637065 RepID=UPI0033C18D5E